MKNFKILMCLCVLVVFSCETEDASLPEEQEFIDVNLTTQTTRSSIWDNWNSGVFELFLRGNVNQIAEVISEDERAAYDFKSIVQNHVDSLPITLENNSVVIPLDAVLGDSESYLYKAITDFISTCWENPGGGYGIPHPPLGGHAALPSTDAYIDHLLNDHCLELYLPFGFQPGNTLVGRTRTIGKTPVIAAPHPLESYPSATNAYSATSFPSGLSLCAPRIDISEGTDYTNLMILRPNPSATVNTDSYCEYKIYNHIDFTDFFEQ